MGNTSAKLGNFVIQKARYVFNPVRTQINIRRVRVITMEIFDHLRTSAFVDWPQSLKSVVGRAAHYAPINVFICINIIIAQSIFLE